MVEAYIFIILSPPHLYTVDWPPLPNFETAARAEELRAYNKNESQISWAHFPDIELLQREMSFLGFSRYVAATVLEVRLGVV